MVVRRVLDFPMRHATVIVYPIAGVVVEVACEGYNEGELRILEVGIGTCSLLGFRLNLLLSTPQLQKHLEDCSSERV